MRHPNGELPMFINKLNQLYKPYREILADESGPSGTVDEDLLPVQDTVH